jgi:hypothetical protein
MPQSGTIEQIRMSHMQEVLMIRYYEADVIEFLLTIASNSERQSGDSEWNVLVLESLYNLMKHIDPKDVFLYKIADGTVSSSDTNIRIPSLLIACYRKKGSFMKFPLNYLIYLQKNLQVNDSKQPMYLRDTTDLVELTY